MVQPASRRLVTEESLASGPAANILATEVADLDADPASLVRQQQDDRIEAGYGAGLRGVAGRDYRTFLGVLRNDGAGSGYWQPLNDAGHQPSLITSVTTTTDSITVNHVAGVKVGSVVAVVDETLAAQGYVVGTSVNLDNTVIKLYRRHLSVSDYVYYNGSAWVSQNGQFTEFSFSAGGVLTLTHAASIDASTANGLTQVTGRGGNLIAHAGGGTATTTQVIWTDYAGTVMTTPSETMKAYVQHGKPDLVTANPQTADTTAYPFSNIWLVGVMEV